MRLYSAAIILFLVTPNTFAGFFGIGSTTWKEEALLHDGSKIVVERSIVRGGRHEIGQLPSYTEQTLTFSNLTTGKTITWEDKATEDLGTSSFLPIAVDIYQGTTFLVMTPMGCLSYNKWGRPNPPYVIFRHQGKAWEQVPLQELPLETQRLNLIASSPDTEVKQLGKRTVNAETVRRINAGFRQPEFKIILREALPMERINRMCEPMVHYKCGWFGTEPNGTFDKEFADRMCNK